MYHFESFMAGEQSLSVSSYSVNRLFSYLGDKGVMWENGAIVGTETLSPSEDGQYLVNERGIRRANTSSHPRTSSSYYVVIDGKLHKKLWSYCRDNNIEVYSFNDIPNENEIDADGYEKEVY